MWNTLGSWTVIGILVPTLIGVGLGILSTSSPAFTAAKVLFSIAAIILIVRIGASLVFTEASMRERGIIAFLLFGLSGTLWVESFHWVKGLEESRLITGRIKVFLGHAYLFNYLGATKDDQGKILDPAVPIEITSPTQLNTKGEVYFVFGIANQNTGIPLEDALLQVYFKRTDNLEVRAKIEGESKEERMWRVHETNVQYWYPFRVVNDEWLHSWQPLWVKFPRPDTYIFRFEITGKWIKKITAEIPVIVRPSAITSLKPDTPPAPTR